MFTQNIFIRRANWHVRIFFAVTHIDADEILDELINAGCSSSDLVEAKRSLWSGLPNSGLTYSNLNDRKTVMVIGYTSDASEAWNIIDHEKNHLLQHIAQATDIDPYGEEISYISGEFIRNIYRGRGKTLLCDCCRKKLP